MIQNPIIEQDGGGMALGEPTSIYVKGTLSSDCKTVTFAWPDGVDPHKICTIYLSSTRTTSVGTGYHIASIQGWFLTDLARAYIENNGTRPSGSPEYLYALFFDSGVDLVYEVGTQSLTAYKNIMGMYACNGVYQSGNKQPAIWISADENGLTVQTSGEFTNIDSSSLITGATFRNTMSMAVSCFK